MKSSHIPFELLVACTVFLTGVAVCAADEPAKSPRQAKRVWTNDDFPESRRPPSTSPAQAAASPAAGMQAHSKSLKASPPAARAAEDAEALRTRLAASEESARIIAGKLEKETDVFRIEVYTKMLEQLRGLGERYRQSLREQQKAAAAAPPAR